MIVRKAPTKRQAKFRNRVYDQPTRGLHMTDEEIREALKALMHQISERDRLPHRDAVSAYTVLSWAINGRD